MKNRTLVKLAAGKHCVGIRTVSRSGKSPREFLVSRRALETLEQEQVVIVNDIHSFAILRRNPVAGTLHIEFTWLRSDGETIISGHKETVTVPYDGLIAFIRDSAKPGGPSKWSALSIVEGKQPRLVFHDIDGLRRCLENIQVRRKLLRFIRDNFKFSSADEIGFYPDFAPYSFFFRAFRNGVPGMAGGLILHGQSDMGKAYYSTHT